MNIYLLFNFVNLTLLYQSVVRINKNIYLLIAIRYPIRFLQEMSGNESRFQTHSSPQICENELIF